MPERIRKAKTVSKLHLLGRGFFTTGVLSTLIEIDQYFVMPAVRDSRITSHIVCHHEGSRKAILCYTVKGKDSKVTITLE